MCNLGTHITRHNSNRSGRHCCFWLNFVYMAQCFKGAVHGRCNANGCHRYPSSNRPIMLFAPALADRAIMPTTFGSATFSTEPPDSGHLSEE